MIGLFIALAACFYFSTEAKKRGESGAKWSFIAFVAFMGPQILVSWFLFPLALVSKFVDRGS